MSKENLRKTEAVYGLNFTEEEINDAINNGKLLSMDIETSLACNLRCIYCYSNAGKKRVNELNTDEILGVIDQAVELGVKVICVIGGGEPLLYPDILKILEYIAQKPVQCSLFTNGVLITKEIAEFLMKNKISVVIKHNSMNEEIQDKLAGVPGTYKKIQSAIKHLLDAGYPSKDVQLGIETIICKYNIGELEKMWIWARERDIIPYFETITYMGRARDHDLNVSSVEVKKLFNKLLQIDEERYNFTWKPHPPIAGLSCQRHFYNIVLTSNGYIKPCVGLDINIGNVRYNNLKDIIQTSDILKTIRNLKNTIKGSCKNCGNSSECYGCRGLTYHITGDYNEADPTCWNNPKRIS